MLNTIRLQGKQTITENILAGLSYMKIKSLFYY